MLACRYFLSPLTLSHSVFLEVAYARAKEERQKSLVGDSSGDSSLDRFSWSYNSLRRWERKLRIQHREYKAENDRVVSLFESKVKIVEAREHALLWQERDVAAKEEELIEREEVLKAKERDYDLLCKDMEAECFRFRKEYRFRHKVIGFFYFCCLFVSF